MKTAVKNISVNHPDFGRLEVSIQTGADLLMLDRVIHLAKQYGNNAKFPTKLVYELATAYQQKSRELRRLQRKITEQKNEHGAIVQALEGGYMQAKAEGSSANCMLRKLYDDVNMLLVQLEGDCLNRPAREAVDQFEAKLSNYEAALGIRRMND